MKKILILLFSILLSFNSYGDSSDETICVETDAQIRGGIIYLSNKDKPFSGKELCKDKKGQIIAEGKIKKGKRVSLTEYTYWDSGLKYTENNYKNDKKNGRTTLWHMNGKKWMSGDFKDDILEGKVMMWDENGQKESEENFKDGVCISVTFLAKGVTKSPGCP